MKKLILSLALALCTIAYAETNQVNYRWDVQTGQRVITTQGREYVFAGITAKPAADLQVRRIQGVGVMVGIRGSKQTEIVDILLGTDGRYYRAE